MTPRQAERALAKALKAAVSREVITFRSLRQLGKRLGINKTAEGTGPKAQLEQDAAAVWIAVESAEWLFKKLFQRDVQAGEDARQEARFRVWKALKCGLLDAAAAKVVAEKAARRCHRKLNRDRQRCHYNLPRCGEFLPDSAGRDAPLLDRPNVRLKIHEGRDSVLLDRPHLRRKINKALCTLSVREREILKLRFGLGDDYNYSRQEVAYIFKLPPYRIMELELKGIRRLERHRGQLVGFLD